jgi:putative phosphoesterase
MNQHLVGIMSDSHDNRPKIQKAVELFNSREVGLVVHAGDIVAPFTVFDLQKLNCPLEMVFGNNDGERIGLAAAFKDKARLLPGPREFSYGGRRFLLAHEDGCVHAAASSTAVNVIIYGHTHDVDVRPGPPLVINPGELGGWLRGRSTVAVLNCETLAVEIIDI